MEVAFVAIGLLGTLAVNVLVWKYGWPFYREALTKAKHDRRRPE